MYRKGAPIATLSERLEALEGWTYSPLVVDEVLADIAARYKGWRIRIVDELSRDTGPLYNTLDDGRDLSTVLHRTIQVKGRTWSISGAIEFEGLSAMGNHEQYVVGLAIFMLFALIALVVYVRTRHLAMEQRLSTERSRLADIIEHASDAMLSTDLDGRICPGMPPPADYSA